MAEKLNYQPTIEPSPDTEPDTRGPEIAFDNAEAVLPQLRIDAHERGRSEDLEGLAWQQGHITYRVTSCDEVLKNGLVLDRKGPRVYKEGSALAFETKRKGSIKIGRKRKEPIVGLLKREIPELATKATPTWVVDKYNINGELIGTEAYSATELEDQLKSTDKRYTSGMTGELSHMWWEDAPPKAPAELKPENRKRINIPGTSGDIFGAITASREQLVDVPGDDWIGLTWNENGNKLQIIKDNDTRVIFHNDDKVVRTYLVKTYSNEGKVLGLKSFNAFELKKYFNGINLFDGAHTDKAANTSDHHWEVPTSEDPKMDPKIRTWAGRIAILNNAGIPVRPVRPAGASELNASEQLLGLGDITTNNPESLESQRKYIEEKSKDPKNAKFVESLGQAIAEYGPAGVYNLANYMRESFLVSMNKLRLQFPDPDPGNPRDTEKLSVSWILWDLAKQRYYAEHPDELDINDPADKNHIDTYGVGSRLMPPNPIDMGSGPTLDARTTPWGLIDPFGDSPDALRKRREFIDREIGKVYLSNVLIPQQSVARGIGPDGNIIEKIVTRYTPNPAYVSQLQHFVKDDVEKILIAVASDENLSITSVPPRIMTRLGRLLRRQLVQ